MVRKSGPNWRDWPSSFSSFPLSSWSQFSILLSSFFSFFSTWDLFSFAFLISLVPPPSFTLCTYPFSYFFEHESFENIIENLFTQVATRNVGIGDWVQISVFTCWLGLSWLRTSARVDKNSILYTWYSHLSEEYTPLCKCFSILFIEESPLCKLTKMDFSIVENVSPDECTPLCKCFQFLSSNNNLFGSWQKWCFLHLKMFSTRRIYT